MLISTIDWIIIFSVMAITMGIGIMVSKKSGQNTTEYFLSGRRMPWWLLGMSMVATTFSTDTPNLVASIVRQDGVSGNWVWWAFLLTGMLTVFVYARLWRKSQVTTDLEFYALRYGGKPARFLRGFRALYLGIAFNVLAMAGVTLAAIKIGEVMLGMDPIVTVAVASTITVIFSAVGGFRGVVYTDLFLFFLAMIGAIGAAFYIVNLPEVGGLSAMLEHPNVAGKLSLLPDFDNKDLTIKILIIPLAVQWWSSWYPGAEPGGGGYVAQRMLAAKTQNHAVGATFFFNALHYALRPWPWILVALASLVMFPDLESISRAFPNVSADKLGDDLGYSAMLTMLPIGLTGIVIASLVSAYMSTISTHLNWGASYIVHDFYREFVAKDSKLDSLDAEAKQISEKKLVNIGRLATVLLMVLSAIIALKMQDALQLFDFILAFGAGTGLIFILRWFWWRINAWSEISAMIASGVISILFMTRGVGGKLFGAAATDELPAITGMFPDYMKFPSIVLLSTIIWVLVTFLTRPESEKVLQNFVHKIQPGGPGWSKVSDNMQASDLSTEGWALPRGILLMLVGCGLVYGTLFTTGMIIYGNGMKALFYGLITAVFLFVLVRLRPRI